MLQLCYTQSTWKEIQWCKFYNCNRRHKLKFEGPVFISPIKITVILHTANDTCGRTSASAFISNIHRCVSSHTKIHNLKVHQRMPFNQQTIKTDKTLSFRLCVSYKEVGILQLRTAILSTPLTLHRTKCSPTLTTNIPAQGKTEVDGCTSHGRDAS